MGGKWRVNKRMMRQAFGGAYTSCSKLICIISHPVSVLRSMNFGCCLSVCNIGCHFIEPCHAMTNIFMSLQSRCRALSYHNVVMMTASVQSDGGMPHVIDNNLDFMKPLYLNHRWHEAFTQDTRASNGWNQTRGNICSITQWQYVLHDTNYVSYNTFITR